MSEIQIFEKNMGEGIFLCRSEKHSNSILIIQDPQFNSGQNGEYHLLESMLFFCLSSLSVYKVACVTIQIMFFLSASGSVESGDSG